MRLNIDDAQFVRMPETVEVKESAGDVPARQAYKVRLSLKLSLATPEGTLTREDVDRQNWHLQFSRGPFTGILCQQETSATVNWASDKPGAVSISVSFVVDAVINAQYRLLEEYADDAGGFLRTTGAKVFPVSA